MTDLALQQSSPPSRRDLFRDSHRWLIPIILIGAPLLVYWPILHNEFVSLDDQITIYENPYFERLTIGSVCAFWLKPYASIYSPVSYTLLALISSFSRAAHVHGHKPPFPFYPAPFHAVDLSLHVLNVLLVYQLLRKFIARPWPATAGALLFALHPVQVESVAWASETNNLLCTLFSLSALLLYLRSMSANNADESPAARRARRSTFILGSEIFLLAILSKPLAVVVPLLAGILHCLRSRNADGALPGGFFASMRFPPVRAPAALKRLIRMIADLMVSFPRSLLWWFALALPFAIVARVGQPVPSWWLVAPIWIRPFVAADAIAFYVCKIFYPMRLLVDYDRSPRVLMEHGWWHYSWILPTLLAGVLIWLWRKKKADVVVAGAAWFVVSLLPVLGLTLFAFQHSSTVADRYLYLPMVGVAMIAAWALDQIHPPLAGKTLPLGDRAARFAGLAACAIILPLLAIRTYFQTDYWHDTVTFFNATREAIHRRPGALQAEDGKNAPAPGLADRYFRP